MMKNNNNIYNIKNGISSLLLLFFVDETFIVNNVRSVVRHECMQLM